MSLSSTRNLPPLLDGEEQDAEHQTKDVDRDDGDGIFTTPGNRTLPLASPNTDTSRDVFREGDSYTVQNSIRHLLPQMSEPKANGVQSDEELDLFAEATVELTLTTPNSQGRREIIGPTELSSNTVNLQSSLHRDAATEKTEDEVDEQNGETFEINISVTNPEKIGEGMNAYMTYKVSTQTTLPAFRTKTLSVRRRFSDFLGLYEKLSVKHNLMGCIIPPPPQKSVVGMTKVKVGKEDPSSAEFVEKRRAALERYLQRVVSHPALLQDSDVHEFLEREELPRAVNTQALSGSGFLKMINKASDAMSKMTIKINEADNWFESKLQEVENEEQLLRRLHASVESLVNHRKELCNNTAMFAKSVAMLGSSEENSALSRALSQLAEVEDKLDQLHHEQAYSDFFILTELLADYVRLLGAVRGCFEQRMKAWQRWQEAQVTLQKKREAEAKLLWANKPDKLQQAKEDITERRRTDRGDLPTEEVCSQTLLLPSVTKEWEVKVGQYERDFERISSTLRKEVHRFEKKKWRDFRHHIVKYLESLFRSQHRLVKCWEAFLPEAKAIV